MSRRKPFMRLLMRGFFFVILLTYSSVVYYNIGLFLPDAMPPTIEDNNKGHKPQIRCENVLDNAVKGKWTSRPLSQEEERDIRIFLETARSQYHIPHSLEREDGKCGNVTFDANGDEYSKELMFFRALCNPNGDSPCCMNGLCTRTNMSDCRCESCLDMRQRLHAEFSEWKPSNPQCHIVNFTQEDACSLLEGGSLVFMGDTTLRHVYVALLMLLNDDPMYGALRPQAPQKVRYECKGMYMFSQQVCRRYIKGKDVVCGGRVHLTFLGIGRRSLADQFFQVKLALARRPRSLLVTGLGLYDTLSKNRLMTLVERLGTLVSDDTQYWPKLIWASAHAPGLLKTPMKKAYNYTMIKHLNKFIQEFWSDLNVPVFESFELTDGVVSFDGTHYGFGVNLQKVQILLNHIGEMAQARQW